MAGRGAYMLMKDSAAAAKEMEKQAKKKGLFGSIGRTLGGLAAAGLLAATGGAATPLVAGLITSAGTFAGGAIGANQKKMKGTGQSAKFHKDARGELKQDLGAFGEANLVGSLQAGVTAGMGQASALKAAKATGEPLATMGAGDFAKSQVGKFMKEKGMKTGYTLFEQVFDSRAGQEEEEEQEEQFMIPSVV